MKILSSVSKVNQDVTITIGNFDSIHSGHKELIKKVQEEALFNSSQSLIYTFLNDTGYMLEQFKNSYLHNTDEKIFLLKKLHLESIFLLPSSKVFFQLSPEKFIHNFLPKKKYIKKIFIGQDFRFGYKRQGNPLLLEKLFGQEKVIIIKDQRIRTNKISSTLIKEKIQEGNLNFYKEVTGRNFFFRRTQDNGSQIGRQINIPTINFNISNDQITPPHGVYVTKTTINSHTYLSVSNLGINPTVKKNTKNIVLETHLLDKDIAHHLKDTTQLIYYVELIKYLRKEKKFSSLNSLKEQIELDIKEVKKCYL